MNIFEKILNLGKNLIKTKLPGKLLGQYFLGRVDENNFWFRKIPCTKGLTEIDPDKCVATSKFFFLTLIIEDATTNDLSHKIGFIIGNEFNFLRYPLEKVVILPKLFLPELFLKKTLKNFEILENFNKNILFLKRCVVVVGLCTLRKI
jgi:hypothetical protein